MTVAYVVDRVRQVPEVAPAAVALLVPVVRLGEVAGGGGDVGVLRVVRQLDLVLRAQEHHLADVLVGRPLRVALELHHHFLHST